MNLRLRGNFQAFSRATAVVVLGVGLTACSTAPGWVDPTSWWGPDTPDTQASPQDGAQDGAQADNQDGTGQYPDLANIPAKPQTASTDDDRTQAAQQLAAARDHVEYSADELRGGTEASAPVPSAAQLASADQSDDSLLNAPSQPAPPPSALTAGTEAAPAAAPARKPAKAARRQVASADLAPPPETAASPAASADTPAPASPAPASPAAASPAPQLIVPQGTEPAFAASKAPPLEPAVANYVAPQIIARYAANGAVAPALTMASNNAIHLRAPAGTRRLKLGTGTSDVGGPEAMSGAVVANLGALPGQSMASRAYAIQGPVSVAFSATGTMLNRKGRESVTEVAQTFAARGGQGYVKVTGFGSGAGGTVGRIEAGFGRAQARARHVAAALIKAGVPAERVLIDTQGQAPYGESGLAVMELQ